MVDSLLFLAFSLGIVSACSLPLGTLTTLIWRPDDRSVGVLMSFGGGALLAALTIDLVGSALAKGEFYWLAVGCVFGGALFVALDNVVNSHGGFLRKSSTVVHYLRRQRRLRFKKALGELERIAAFRDLPKEDIEDLASAVVQEVFEKGATIYSAGDPSDFLYVVEKGEVSVSDPRERERVPIVYGRRATPGQHAFITGSPHTHHAVATERTHVWMLPREEFHGNLGLSTALTASTIEFVSSEGVAEYLKVRQGLTSDQIAEWRRSALAGLSSGIIPNAVTIERHRDEFVRMSDGIRRLPIFRGLSPEDLRAVADRLFCVRYERGDTIFRHGEPADRFYVVETGRVALLTPADSLNRRVTIERGEAFGGKSFITNARRAQSAIAIDDSELWVLRKSDFDTLMHGSPAIHERVRAYLEGTEARNYLSNVQGLAAPGVERWIRQATRNVDSGRLIPSATDMARHVDVSHGAPVAIRLGILLDGIPESLVIGSSLIHHSHVSFSLIAGLFLSNYPEALSRSVGMRQQGMSFMRVLVMWTSLMVLTGIGAALGSVFFVDAASYSFALVEGIAAGAMLTMIAQTMAPEAYLKAGPVVGMSTLMGFLAAIFFKTLE